MATDPKDNKTVDIESTKTDRAIQAVKAFQAGKATVAFTRQAVREALDDVEIVSLGTRVPVAQLRSLASRS